MGKHSHLSLSQRSDIEVMLSKKMSFNKIALAIGKDNTTVSKEIKKHNYRTDRLIRQVF